jgi:ABC-type multidrug transport system permease subunit
MEDIMRAGSIVTLAVLAFLLAGAIAMAYFVLHEPGRPMPPSFFAALIIGSLLTLAVGAGLMGLLFYSHRKGFDEPPRLLPPR